MVIALKNERQGRYDIIPALRFELQLDLADGSRSGTAKVGYDERPMIIKRVASREKKEENVC